MGEVFLATDTSRNCPVAVKVLHSTDPDAVARFGREAEVLLQLQHPGIVRYLAHGETPEGQPFLVMEWLDGETLKERLERAPLSVVEVLDLALGLVAAVATAHTRSVVHRDIKPANIFLVGRSVSGVRLVDFGVARVRSSGPLLTQSGDMIGTPAYMSPEQARGDSGVDRASDVFSLGVVLFRLLAGVLPFRADDALGLLIKLTSEDAPPLASVNPDVAPRLARLVDAMLARSPAARPTDPRAIYDELLAVRSALAAPLQRAHVVAPGPAVRTMLGATALPPPAAAGVKRGRAPAIAAIAVATLSLPALVAAGFLLGSNHAAVSSRATDRSLASSGTSRAIPSTLSAEPSAPKQGPDGVKECDDLKKLVAECKNQPVKSAYETTILKSLWAELQRVDRSQAKIACEGAAAGLTEHCAPTLVPPDQSDEASARPPAPTPVKTNQNGGPLARPPAKASQLPRTPPSPFSPFASSD